MKYICRRCGYESNVKANLIKHLQRKVACQHILEDIEPSKLIEELNPSKSDKPHKCNKCGKSFAFSNSMYRHQKRCQHDNQKNSSEINELREKIKLLEEKINSQPQNINNGTIQNIQQNIQVNALGNEDISHITEHRNFKNFMAKCIRDKIDGVCEFLVKKHFDDKHPENHNLKKLRRDDFMEVFDGRKWKIRYSDDILDDVFLYMHRDFANFVDEAISDEGLLKRVWLNNFMKTVGEPLEWDLTNEDFTYQEEMTPDQKSEMRTKIYKLACEYIYRNSQNISKLQ